MVTPTISNWFVLRKVPPTPCRCSAVHRVDRLSRSVCGLAQILEELGHAHAIIRPAGVPVSNGSVADQKRT
jgi:hypothetical protein